MADPSLPPGGGWRQSSSWIPGGSPKPDKAEDPREQLNAAAVDLKKLAEFASHLGAAKVDQIKLSVRNLVLYAALGVVGLIVSLGVLTTAGALIMIGIAHALGALFGIGWLGDLVAGILVLGVVAVAALIVLKKLTHTFRSQTVNKYEQRRQQQRADFGTDVHEQAQRGY